MSELIFCSFLFRCVLTVRLLLVYGRFFVCLLFVLSVLFEILLSLLPSCRRTPRLMNSFRRSEKCGRNMRREKSKVFGSDFVCQGLEQGVEEDGDGCETWEEQAEVLLPVLFPKLHTQTQHLQGCKDY